MRRTAFLLLPLAVAGCHHKAAGAQGGPVADASEPTALAPIDSGDPSMLSRASETESQIDPSLAVSADGTVATAWLDVRAGQPSVVGVRFSKDGGKEWEPAQTIASPDEGTASQPLIRADDQGTTYLTWVGAQAGDGGRDSHVYLAVSSPDDHRLGAPLVISQGMRREANVDSPWMFVAPGGAAIVSWAYAQPLGNGIAVATSADGKTWKHSVVIERVGLQALWPRVCASTSGDRAWVTYLDGEVGLRVRASDDRGASWSPSRVATVSAGDEQSHVARDGAACAGEGDDVTVVYGRSKAKQADGGLPAIDSLVVSRSFDGGRTFDARHVIDLSEPGMHPQMVREPDGSLDIAYYAVSAAPDASSLRWVHVNDANATGPHVARDHLAIARDPRSKAWPGDAFGLAFHDGSLLAATVDATGGLPHVTFTRIASR